MLLDAGVWVAAAAPGEKHHAAAGALVRRHRQEVAALDLTLYEITNVVAVKHRQPHEARRLTRAVLLACGDGRLIRADAELLESAAEIAAEHGLTAYDAAYVVAARRGGMTLVSTDVADLVSKGLAVTPDAALYP